MAHKKGQGSSRNGRDSPGQRRGVKRYGGETVTSGSILVRQVGTLIHPGTNVKLGRDFTLYSTVDGIVTYERLGRDRKKVSVYSEAEAKSKAEKAAANEPKPKPAKAAKPAAKAAPAAQA